MMAHRRIKFLDDVNRKMVLLGHSPTPWKKDITYSSRCEKCGLVVNVKLALKLSDLDETQQCKGNRNDEAN